jgi:endonuclease YncB( thermonuclease family)
LRARALVLFALVASGAAHADLSGRVVAVHDGDTITVLSGRAETRVRLVGIDAPERFQPYGSTARRALADLVAGRDVRVVGRARDRFGRLLGRVYADAVDVNAELVRLGHAWVFRDTNDATLRALEAEAKAAGRGLWRDSRAVAPWQWRDRPPAPAPAPKPVPAPGRELTASAA